MRTTEAMGREPRSDHPVCAVFGALPHMDRRQRAKGLTRMLKPASPQSPGTDQKTSGGCPLVIVARRETEGQAGSRPTATMRSPWMVAP